MITLHLTGYLATLFGEKVSLDAKTPREAVTALSYQSSEYKEAIRYTDWHIFVGEGNDITESELDMRLGKISNVFLIPIVEGAGGAFNVVLGAVLIGAGFMTFGASAAVGVALMSGGAGMLVGGIVQMLTKIPGSTGSVKESTKEDSSFLFQGVTNTSSQGAALPRGYGRVMVGSIVVSASLYAEQTPFEEPEAHRNKLIDKVSNWKK